MVAAARRGGRGGINTAAAIHSRGKPEPIRHGRNDERLCYARRMNAPSISIVLPTHNRARLLPRAVRSVLAQTDVDFELVVIDDGSSDGTQDVLASLPGDARIRLLRNETPGGAAAARNRAIRSASGEWVAFLDDDDELLPDYLVRLRSHLHALPAAGLVWTGVERLYHDSTPPRSEILQWQDRWDGMTPAAHPFLLFFALSFGVAIRRSALLDAGLFDERFSATEDIDLAMRLVAAGTPYAALPEVLLRVHIGEGASVSRSRDHRSALRLLLLQKNAAFLATQPALLAHYRLFAMSGLYRDGRKREARTLASALLRSGGLDGRGFETVLRYELFAPIKRLFRRQAGAAV
ncbi:MAG: glycosyltransferase family 2 protein [Nevskia sp.]|nr:glycosyltransferase family 2 protein [Nevskia sp.]